MEGRGFKRMRRGSGESAILVYHRVGTSRSDPLRLNVTPENLEAQLAVIASRWRPTSLAELTDSLERRGEPPAGSIAVTFDDGYHGVLADALPLLARYGMPATAFIVSGFVDKAFWWETLDSLVRSNRTPPANLDLDVAGRRFRWPASRIRLRRRSLAPSDELFYALCRLLMVASHGERERVIAELAAWSGVDAELDRDRRPLSADGVRELAASGVVEIGGHTVTHPVLATLAEVDQEQEITGGKAALEELIGDEVTSFAYPYGGRHEYDASSVKAVGRAGYRKACANIQSPIGANSSTLELPRLIVGDWDGPTFAQRLNGWLGHRSANEVTRTR